MQHTRYVEQITGAEWRWVMICSTALVLLALLPFALMPLALNGQPRAFMGAVHDPQGTASALASMRLGQQGEWLWRSLHTPEPQIGIISDALYILLGQVARLARIDVLALFHIARVLAGLFMFHALYSLAAAIWSRVNTRRIFWFIASVGAGVGWIAAPLLKEAAPDIQTSLMFPFHAVLTNVQLPVAIGCICFLAAAMLDSLRPDSYDLPNVTNSGLTLIVFSITLALTYASAFAPLGLTYAIALAIDGQRRTVIRRNLQWFGWFIVPALPLLVYYGIVTFSDPLTMQLWQLESHVDVPSPAQLLIALGLPLVIALPGLWRAVRRFESDGSAFMLIWLAAMLVLAYGLSFAGGKFLLGLMVPLAYFVARACSDFWFPRIGTQRWRYRLVAGLLPILAASQAVALVGPLVDVEPRLTLPPDYSAAFRYLRARSGDVVVLTSPQVGVWLPAWTGKRVVYATANLTLGARAKSNAVARWYSAADPAACPALLDSFPSVSMPYPVRFVLVGPLERQIGSSACVEDLVEMAQFGSVTLYLTVR